MDKNNLIAYPQYFTQSVVASISCHEYADNYRDIPRFLNFCKQCPSYGATFACPPFDFDVAKLIEPYQQVILIGTKIVFSDATKQVSTTLALREQISHNATFAVVDTLAEIHDAVLQAFPASLSFLVGACRQCAPRECTRRHNLPCRYPDRVRHSIESIGFDVGKTAKELLGIELLWSSDHHLPDYQTLVTALFTNAPVAEVLSFLSEKLDVGNNV